MLVFGRQLRCNTSTSFRFLHKLNNKFSNFYSGIGYHIHRANFILSLISVLVNLAHITILCRKSMRTSATNVILIGLSISDMCIVMTTVYKHLFMIDFENSDWYVGTHHIKQFLIIISA